MLLVMFQGRFTRKTFSTVSKGALEGFSFFYPTMLLMDTESHFIAKCFLAILTAEADRWLWMFLLKMLLEIILCSKSLRTKWTAHLVLCCSTALNMTMEMSRVLDENTTLGTLFKSHDWWKLEDVNSEMCTRQWSEIEWRVLLDCCLYTFI